MLAGARTLVTGAGGFIGANLVRGLIARSCEVTAVLGPTTDSWRLREIESNIRLIRSDICELGTRNDVGDVDFVFHLAATAINQRTNDVPAMLHTNVGGTYAVMEMAARLKVRRFIHLGSSGEYGPSVRAREDQALLPNSEYGATKAASTLLVHAFSQRTGLSSITLRPFSVFGPFESSYRLVPYCVLRAMDGRTIEVTGGTQTRDYVYVDDVVAGILVAAETSAGTGETINLCSGVSTAVRDLVQQIVGIGESHVQPVFGARPHVATEMWESSGDPARAARVLGWRAETPLGEALRKTVEWFRFARTRYDHYGRPAVDG